jgi:hypothetical protein
MLKTRRFELVIEPKIHSLLVKKAKEERRSVSNLVRLILEKALQDNTK